MAAWDKRSTTHSVRRMIANHIIGSSFWKCVGKLRANTGFISPSDNSTDSTSQPSRRPHAIPDSTHLHRALRMVAELNKTDDPLAQGRLSLGRTAAFFTGRIDMEQATVDDAGELRVHSVSVMASFTRKLTRDYAPWPWRGPAEWRFHKVDAGNLVALGCEEERRSALATSRIEQRLIT